ncbi:MAG: universal stress protein [Desulforhopalus sp.]
MFKNILVPVDGSEHALKALELAGDLADKYGCDLTVLHVRSKEISEEFRAYIEVEYTEKEREDMPGILEKTGNKLINALIKKAKPMESPKTVVLYGDPAANIIKYVKANNIDTVVMGCRGMSDLKGLLVGSVSHKVSNLIECTCIMVK